MPESNDVVMLGRASLGQAVDRGSAHGGTDAGWLCPRLFLVIQCDSEIEQLDPQLRVCAYVSTDEERIGLVPTTRSA
jgi:hypothetical protein